MSIVLNGVTSVLKSILEGRWVIFLYHQSILCLLLSNSTGEILRLICGCAKESYINHFPAELGIIPFLKIV